MKHILWVLTLLCTLQSNTALSQDFPIDPYAEMINMAHKMHNPTSKMKRLAAETFKELDLEPRKIYFAPMAEIARQLDKPRAIGVCFSNSKTIIVDTAVFSRMSEKQLKLTIAHELLHCEADFRSHDNRKVKTPVGVCGYSLMFPSIAAPKCAEFMYKFYMTEARNMLQMMGK